MRAKKDDGSDRQSSEGRAQERRRGAVMLTRTETARELGVSVSTVRRLERSRLHPVTELDGSHVFDAEEIRTLARERADTRIPRSSGELAARACELFREGRGVVDVVIALRQPFELVREWQRSYLADAGTLLVPEVLAHQMREAFFVEQEPFTAEGLFQLLERLTSRNVELGRRLRDRT
jgi:hypothetical protein